MWSDRLKTRKQLYYKDVVCYRCRNVFHVCPWMILGQLSKGWSHFYQVCEKLVNIFHMFYSNSNLLERWGQTFQDKG